MAGFGVHTLLDPTQMTKMGICISHMPETWLICRAIGQLPVQARSYDLELMRFEFIKTSILDLVIRLPGMRENNANMESSNKMLANGRKNRGTQEKTDLLVERRVWAAKTTRTFFENVLKEAERALQPRHANRQIEDCCYASKHPITDDCTRAPPVSVD